jgi:hypothetical protein
MFPCAWGLFGNCARGSARGFNPPQHVPDLPIFPRPAGQFSTIGPGVRAFSKGEPTRSKVGFSEGRLIGMEPAKGKRR